MAGGRALGGGGAGAGGVAWGARVGLVSLGSRRQPYRQRASGLALLLRVRGHQAHLRGSQIHITAMWMSSDRTRVNHTRGTATTAPLARRVVAPVLHDGSESRRRRIAAATSASAIVARSVHPPNRRRSPLTVPVHYRRERTRQVLTHLGVAGSGRYFTAAPMPRNDMAQCEPAIEAR